LVSDPLQVVVNARNRQGKTQVLGQPYVDLPRMSELVEEQVRNSLNAALRRDIELAQKVMAADDQVDHYRDQIFRELLMGDSSHRKEQASFFPEPTTTIGREAKGLCQRGGLSSPDGCV
jgi:phosphate uptake regulator